eukprot:CAMPEP_0198153612 /NCGR_PEP_ID=MMETSP1443-20131203/64972_1 /TAXON_ID=186043 /ORGANISM="Entomoneis sp., Strain CCMP2396" /LENGTH=228 /DNA_ID=CAMNT_0043820011 /DNA_START=295 /DNA_END=981 /DNA_ORIENTATION=-
MSYDENSEWYSPPPPKTKSGVKLPKGVVPNVRNIKSNVEFLEFLNEDDRLCIVKFHASWCKSCQKFNVHFDKFAREQADWVDADTGAIYQTNSFRVAAVEYTACKQLCNALGIEKLPTVFLYGNGRKLAEVSVGASKFQKVRDAVQQYSNFNSQDREFAANMEEGANLIKQNVLAPVVAATQKKSTAMTSEQKMEKLAAQLTAAPANAAPQRNQWWTPRNKAASTTDA